MIFIASMNEKTETAFLILESRFRLGCRELLSRKIAT